MKEEFKGRMGFVGGCLVCLFLVALGYFLIQEGSEIASYWKRDLATVGGWLALVAGIICFYPCLLGARDFYSEWDGKRRNMTAVLVAVGVILWFVVIGGDTDSPMTSLRWAIGIFGSGLAITGALLSVPRHCSNSIFIDD